MGAGGGVKLAAEQEIADKIAAAKAKLVMAGVVVLGPGGRFDERPATYAP